MRRVLPVAAVLAVCVVASPSAAVPQLVRLRQDAGLESRFVGAINDARAEAGLGALRPYVDLTDDARAHTARMIASGDLFHSDRLGGYATGWSLLGENVGFGPSVVKLHDAFMASPSHRKNVLDEFDRVGVGADTSQDGAIYVTVLFMQTALPGQEVIDSRQPYATGLAWSLVGLEPPPGQ